MRLIFADTFYWIAFVNPADAWYRRVRQAFKQLEPCKLITTDEVLVELLAFYSKSGVQLRQRVANLVRDILDSPDIEVKQQTHESFLAGLTLYENRLDKGYSLTDCISMNTVRELGIIEVLKTAEEIRQSWEERNRYILTQIAAIPPKPGQEALWKKLQAQKVKHAVE